jgi:hypothetical protein
MGDYTDPGPGIPGFMIVFIVIVGVLFAFGIGTAIYQSVRVARSGHNPLTLETDLAVTALDSQTLAPPKGMEQRLREVDDLFARGVISEAEHSAARAAMLTG